MAPPVLDEYGLVRDNGILVIHIPAMNGIIPIRVKMRMNKGYEQFIYGPLPVSFSGYDAGVIPAGQQTDSITFYYVELPPEIREDMFYYVEPNTLIHAYLKFEPIMLRILTEIPKGNKVYSLYDRVTQDLTKDFGWFRGEREMVFLPKLHIGWKFYNPTNLDLRTNLIITYGEYAIELITNADVIYRILTHQIPAHWFTFGGKHRFYGLEDSLKVLGVEVPVPYLPEYISKDEAIKIINDVISAWRR